MKGDKIIANYNNAQRTNKRCVCVHIETGESYDLIGMQIDTSNYKRQMLFENSSDGTHITATEDDVEDKFMLMNDWITYENKYKNCVYPALITNLTNEDLKEEVEKGEPIKTPIAYFKFKQYNIDNTFIYECIYTNPAEKINDTFIVRLTMDELEEVISQPVEVAERYYNGRKKYLSW